MQKFCTPTSYGDFKDKKIVQPAFKIVVPELAKKLVEVEYMMRDKIAPPMAAITLFSQFKKEKPNAKDTEFKAYLGNLEEI